ncbi:unnamed protein product [Owenia fusiformis]|uniref:Nephrocystin-4 n=1 Tax=Owenia fusiformis TaxID=6347 RepID=A0A8S4N226_OWEFU|nr:unnamed protein product [Owenia fusiformis]
MSKIKAWKELLLKKSKLQLAYDRQQQSGEISTPFCISIRNVEGLVQKIDTGQAEFEISMSLFDVTYKQFFGHTWHGPAMQAKTAAGQKLRLNYNQNVYLHTSLNDLNIIAVLEVAAVTYGDNGKQERHSCGWGLFRVFKYEGDMLDTNSASPAPTQKIDIYHGSPRALLYMEDPIESNEYLTAISGCQLYYTIRTHKSMVKIMHLVPENFLVGQQDTVPGIMEVAKDPTGSDNLRKPKLLKTLQCHIDQVSLNMLPQLDKFEEELCKLLNEDRINRENKVADGTIVAVIERRLQIGVHNGLCYVQEPQCVYLALDHAGQGMGTRRTSSLRRGGTLPSHSRSPSVGSLGSLGSALVLKNRVELEGMCEDPMMTVVFMLEYVVGEPISSEERKLLNTNSRSQSHTVAVRWAAWSPFNSNTRNSDITIQMLGGPTICPDSVHVYKNPPTEMQELSAAKKAAGSLTFNFVNEKFQKPQGEKSTNFHQAASLLHQHKHLSTSQASMGTEGESSILNEIPVTPGKPPMPRRTGTAQSYLSVPGSGQFVPPPQASMMFPQNQVFAQGTQSGYSPAPTPMMSGMVSSGYPGLMQSMNNMYPMEITHLRDPVSARMGMGSPELNELPFTPVHAPIMVTAPNMTSGQGLSRAAYAKLYNAGFPPILDRNDEPPEVVDPTDVATFVMGNEEADDLQCNEITLQFLAFSKMLSSGDSPTGSKQGTVFFTFQFYKFPQVTTERLLLGTVEGDLSMDPQCLPCLLQKLNNDGSVLKGLPGYQMKYYMDPNYLTIGEGRLFVKYLAEGTLHIDVWDGDSLLLIGSCSIELKPLCRQGREAVQVTYELDVVATEYSETDQEPMMTDPNAGAAVRPVGVQALMKGRLHLRMANVGYEADRKARTTGSIQIFGTPQKVVDQRGKSSFLGGSLNAGITRMQGTKRNKAMPLTATNQELASLLNTNYDKSIRPLEESNREGDSAKQRKLRRMEALRKLEGSENQLQTVTSFRQEKAERMQNLRTIELYRSENKRDGILNMLNQAISKEYTIHPCMGTTEFFEFVLTNPYNVKHTINLEWEDADLNLITDAREWRYFKVLNNLNTPVEEGMFNTQSSSLRPEIFLRPKETVHVPFRYLTFRADHSVQSQGPHDPYHPKKPETKKENVMDSKIIKIHFKTEENKPVAILSLHVAPQPHIVDQTFRFHHPEQSFLKKSIRLPPVSNLPNAPIAGEMSQIFVRCSDPNVICETRMVPSGEPMDMSFKVACGASPQLKKFFIAIYTDHYQSKPVQTWQFYVHSLQRVDVQCVEGQTSRFSLILRGTQASRLVKCFSSQPKEMQIKPNQAFMLPAGAVQEINVGVRPLQVGSKFLYLNVVDTEYHQLIRTWLVCISCRAPLVSKAFELMLPVGGGKGSNKRISYMNPYPTKKTFLLCSNRDDLVQFRDTRLEIGAMESASIGLRFAPSQTPGSTEILVFINDEDDKNEETFCIKAVYS